MILKSSHLWLVRASSDWHLNPLDVTLVEVFLAFFYNKIFHDHLILFLALALESAVLTRNPGSFKKDMVIRGHDLGPRGAHWFWFSHYFRPLLWTELENIFFYNLIMKAKKAELLSSYCTFISIEGNGIKTGRDRKKLLRNTWISVFERG